MATGIVYSLIPPPSGTQPVSGSVQQDETGDIYSFQDTNFPNTGLNVGDACTFDIVQSPKDPTSFFATNLQRLVATPPKNITGPFTGDITSNVGDVYTISGSTAVVTGNIIINGGKVIVEQDAQVHATSAHSITNDGVFVARKGGTVNGTIGINSGGNLKVVNKGNVVGNINVNQAGRIMVGNQNGPGYVTGTLDIQGLRDLRVTPDSKITS